MRLRCDKRRLATTLAKAQFQQSSRGERRPLGCSGWRRWSSGKRRQEFSAILSSVLAMGAKIVYPHTRPVRAARAARLYRIWTIAAEVSTNDSWVTEKVRGATIKLQV